MLAALDILNGWRSNPTMPKLRGGPPEYDPPVPIRVARRALVLSGVVCRANLERSAEEPWATGFLTRMLSWMGDLGLDSETEPNERLLLRAPLGTINAEGVINASWRSEGLVVLAWSLDHHAMPAYDEVVDPREVTESLGFLTEKGRELLDRPRLRPEIDLEDFAALIVALHGRLREFLETHQPVNFQKVWEETSSGPLRTAGLRFVENDLAVRGVALGQAQGKVIRTTLSITRERHMAVDWLRGRHPVYSEVRID